MARLILALIALTVIIPHLALAEPTPDATAEKSALPEPNGVAAKSGVIDRIVASVGEAEHGVAENYGVPPLSVGEAIDTALAKSPYLKAADLDAQAALTQVQEARGHAFPTVVLSESIMRTDQPAWNLFERFGQQRYSFKLFQDFQNPDRINHLTPYTNFQTKLQIEQPVYTGGRLGAGMDQARLGAQAEAQAKERVRQEVIFDVVRTYYGVLLAQRGEYVAKLAVKTVAAHVKTAENLYRAGVVVKSDVLSAQVHLAKTREQAIIAGNQVNLAKAALNHYMGVEQTTEYTIQGDLNYVPVFYGLAELIKEALAERPDLQQVIFGTEATRRGIDFARAGYYPTVGVMANYAFDDHGPKDLFSDGRSYTLAAMANWTVFDGLITQAQVERATLATQKMEQVQERVKSGIALQVRQAYLALDAARKRIEVTRSAVDQATESQRIIHSRYEAGVTTMVEVLDADTALLGARLAALQARYDHNLAQVELDFALGRLKS